MTAETAKGTAAFAREAVRTFRATGAIAPSSRHLAGRLAALVAPARHPAAVLEVGAGTGAVTRALAARLGPADRLDAVEVNPRFAEVLQTVLATDPALAAVADRVRVIASPIASVRLDRRYDAVISGLPFMNFDAAEVRDILDRYLAALVPGGQLMLYGYLGTTVAGRLVNRGAGVARQREVSAVLADFEQRYGCGRLVVWSNLPPARIRHLRAPD
jgi:phospholipid N-methyltransferase